jgi:hypothetical protein
VKKVIDIMDMDIEVVDIELAVSVAIDEDMVVEVIGMSMFAVVNFKIRIYGRDKW